MVKFTLDRNCSLSYYEQIKGQIISCLYTGKLREGDRLPTIRQMAEDLSVNYKTVQKIYNRLQQEGYVEVNRGSGAFIRRQQASEFEELRRKAISNLIKDTLDRANRLGLSPEKFAALLDTYIAPSQHKPLSCAVVDDEEEALVFSKELQRRLGIDAQPVPLALLADNEKELFAKVRGIEYFLTTSWHLEQVRKYAFSHRKKVLEIKPNPQIYQEILKEVQTRNVAVIVQDARTIHASMEVFMNIYHPSTTKKFFISPIGDKEQLQAMLDEAELIYTSPLCWDEIRKLTPARVEIRTFKDFIAEESLEALREIRLFE